MLIFNLSIIYNPFLALSVQWRFEVSPHFLWSISPLPLKYLPASFGLLCISNFIPKCLLTVFNYLLLAEIKKVVIIIMFQVYDSSYRIFIISLFCFVKMNIVNECFHKYSKLNTLNAPLLLVIIKSWTILLWINLINNSDWNYLSLTTSWKNIYHFIRIIIWIVNKVSFYFHRIIESINPLIYGRVLVYWVGTRCPIKCKCIFFLPELVAI